MKTVHFTKYDANGNTFVVIDVSVRRLARRSLGRLSRRICDSRTGVGADGLLTVRDLRTRFIQMEVFNADGTWAERSGNGLRAAVADRAAKKRSGKNWLVKSGKDILLCKIEKKTANKMTITTELGEPELVAGKFSRGRVRRNNQSMSYIAVKVGNPHIVIFVRNFDFDWKILGAELSKDPHSKGGANVEFVRLVKRGSFDVSRSLDVRVWERGVGPTRSSGTGAAAALVASREMGLAGPIAKVKFENETLTVSWEGWGESVFVTGSVERLLSGEINI